MDSKTFYDLVGSYGLIAIFFLSMIEGDITLLLGGVLAHSAFFGDYSLAKVLCFGTLGGVVGDNIAYGIGRGFGKSIRNVRFYRMAKPRIEKLSRKFGPLAIFISKYIYGIRFASCIFWGVSRMPYLRFLPSTLGSVFLWVLVLSSVGYFYSTAVMKFMGNFQQMGVYLLVIVVIGIAGFYLAETLWFSKKIEQADPERLQELEQAAQEKLHELQERITFKPQAPRRKDSPPRSSGVAKGSSPTEGE
jgi:membrane protein DedA with SNARE-associated domain